MFETKRNPKTNTLSMVLVAFAFFFLSATIANAAIPTMSALSIVDSEEPTSRRIYSYDMQVDAHDNVHIIYSKPTTGDKANIYYVRRVSGVWEDQHILISSDGHVNNKSSFLLVGENDLIHICYTKSAGSDGEGLYYRTINNGTSGPEKFIYPGQWFGKMQLGSNGYPIFVRSDINWQTDNTSKLVMHTTTDGETWEVSDINVPSNDTDKLVMADFIYSNGVFHITWGDSAYERYVWASKAMDKKEWHVFHDFHYATSSDGKIWEHHVVDDTHTLRYNEFWTSLTLDSGRPLVGMFKYAEYDNLFSAGTSGKLSTWTGYSWEHKIITNQIYPDTNEGMGVGVVVNGPGDYFGAWDFSPKYPQLLPPNIEGNTAMRRSGDNGKWENVAQLGAFSLEGSPKLRIHGGKLYFLGLGDYTNTRVYFREFSIPTLSEILPASAPVEANGNVIPTIYRLLLKKQ